MIEQIWSGILAWSGQFVVPDWGKLVGLIPLALAVLVLLFVTWTIYRFATAGPKRRGPGRRPPVAPAGIHMPGPSFAPFLAAIGAFFMVFGTVSGGIWLAVGILILVVTLLYWGREATRDYDAIGAGAAAGPAAGALPAPYGTPPAGVHMPPPSFRPLLVAIAFTLLVAGMIAGGVALLIGALAVVVALLGWLRDARREYAATEEADRTGHLDLGGRPAWPIATFAVLAVLVAVGVLLGSGLLSGSGSGSGNQAGTGSAVPASAAAGGTGGAAATAVPSLPAADATLTAEKVAFTPSSITVPAAKPFTLAFDNKDSGVPHNVELKDAGGAVVFKGDIVTGPAVTVYHVPALPAGQYAFVCSVHPNMTGTATAQ
jgi:plastocyanin